MSKAFTSKPVSVAAALLLSALTLAACGSGGGSGSGGDSGGGSGGGSTVNTAEGFWAGPTGVVDNATQKNYTMAGSVLENGEYWFLVDLNGTITGMVQGKGSSSNGTFTTSTGPTRLNGQYVAKTSLQGTVKDGAGVDVFAYNMAYDATYEQPPGFSIAGTDWVGSLPLSTRAPFNITITPSGALTGTSTDDCRLDGTLVPRPGSKRIYNATLTVNGSVCTGGVATRFTGVAEPTSNQGGTLKQRILIKAIDDSTQSVPLVILSDR
jgi:hypothetical protein